jgi:serine/threonine-protein kinase
MPVAYLMSSEELAHNPSPVREGDVIAGKYKVEKVLGIGGMGVVVAATHVDLRQKVALKFLLPAAATSSELVERFLREARASVRLKGKHVAQVLDVGRLDNGCPYLVMEYLDGHDLSFAIKDAAGPMPVESVATYILHACEGLAEAHALGIVHRDLKPGNLFLTKTLGGHPMVKVLDFGISKTLDPINVEDQISSLTKTEMLLGSPLYMSPEQLRSSKNVDSRADVWAIGAIAYEMLTSKVPFEADSLLELCWKVAQENARPILEVRPDMPEPLAKAVMRCLEKDVSLRWSDVGALAVAVEPFAAERERGSAARAVDVLKTSTRRTNPNPPEALPTPQEIPKQQVVVAAPSSSKQDGEAWGTTQREGVSPLARAIRRRNMMIVGVGVGALTLAAIGFAASRSGGAPATTTNASGNTTASVSATASTPATPSVTASSMPTPTETVSASATASTTAAAPPTVIRNKPQPTTAKSAPKPPTSTTDPAGFIKVRE